jgi:hypothetical protein
MTLNIMLASILLLASGPRARKLLTLEGGAGWRMHKRRVQNVSDRGTVSGNLVEDHLPASLGQRNCWWLY